MKLEDSYYEFAVCTKTVMFLRWLRVFPTEEEIKYSRKKILSKYGLITLVGFYFPIGMVLNLIKKVNMHIYTNIDEDIMMLLSFLGVSFFAFRFSAHTEKLAVVYRKLSDFEKFGKPIKFDQFNDFMNNTSVAFFISTFTAVLFISFSNVFLIKSCKKNNARNDINDVCGMIGRIWLPFDYDYFPLKPIVFTYELYASVMAYNTAAYINWVIFETVEHINFKFRHLQQTFVELLKIEDCIMRRKQFNKAVQYHSAIIEVAEIACSCFKPCCMIHLSLTAPVVGIAGYRLVTTTQLTDILYNTEWHRFDQTLRKDMALVMLRARHAIYLSAGPLGNMGYATIVLLGKTAYSYLTLLNQSM